MKQLLSAKGLHALDAICRVTTLFAFDFDGTLAPIVSNHAAAAIPAPTLRLLRQLSALVPVVIVSGRRLKDLRVRLRLRSVYVIGNHGIEHPTATRHSLRAARHLCAAWLPVLSAKLGAELAARQVDIEDKRYSLTIHFRRAGARRALLHTVRRLTPAPRIVAGKWVINLLPPGAPDKGSALQLLLRDTQIQHMIFVGDDVTDEDVFALRERRIVSVRIGKKASSRARYYLRMQAEINPLLEYLLARLRASTAAQKRK
ncbi:MAG: trehalose-phosphatase [Gammaproteobacteria bacterium]|nr:trehalose-phosphatase [Gammaproteobacteria bacterium]